MDGYDKEVKSLIDLFLAGYCAECMNEPTDGWCIGCERIHGYTLEEILNNEKKLIELGIYDLITTKTKK